MSSIDVTMPSEAAAGPVSQGLLSRLTAPPTVAIGFGLLVIGSGLWRFLSREGGHKGLIFGLVMGGLALLAPVLWARGLARTGWVPLILSLAFVAGWFAWESFHIVGFADAEPRQLFVLVCTLLVTVGLVVGARRGH